MNSFSMFYFYEKDKFILDDGRIKIKKFLNGVAEYRSIKEGDKKIRKFTLFPKQKTIKEPVFYLKIHGIREFSLKCFQKWVDVAHEMGAMVILVCDDKETKKAVCNNIIFHDDVEIITTRIKELKPYVDAITCKLWHNAAFAKLAIFLHSKKNNIKHFWKIDADDTEFLLKTSEIAKLLKNAEKIAEEQEIKAFSLDMHNSKLFDKYWSFGVCYIDNQIDWFSIFEKYMNNGWKEKYEKRFKECMNLDWFFTYLRNENIVNIKSFYIENSFFYHHFERTSSFMKLLYWNNGFLEYPYFRVVDTKFSKKPINSSCICIGKVDKEEGEYFFRKEILCESDLIYRFSIFDDNSEIFYPPQGLGDILFVCSLMKEYKKINPEKRVIICVTKQHFYDLAKLYKEDVDEVIFYKEHFSIEKMEDKIYKDKTFYEIYHSVESFKYLFTKALGMKNESQFCYPEIEKIEDNSLKNTILIAPDTVSCPKIIDDDFWLNIADELSKKGIKVMFNCVDEKRFVNYEKVFLDIKTTIQKVNNMKAFISYRSGLADVIGAFCRETPQFVVYPSENIPNLGNFSTEKEGVEAYFEFCSIKKNFDNDFVNEYIYEDNMMDMLVKKCIEL